MKHSPYFLFSISILIVTFLSCDKVKEVASVTINSTEKISAVVVLSPGEAISLSSVYDLSNNADINNYLNTLEDVEITEASYVITSFSGTSVSVTGQLSFSLADSSFGPFQHSFFQDAEAKKKTTLDAGKLNAAATKLLQERKISIAVEGSHSIPASQVDGETITIELYLKLKFTASAI